MSNGSPPAGPEKPLRGLRKAQPDALTVEVFVTREREVDAAGREVRRTRVGIMLNEKFAAFFCGAVFVVVLLVIAMFFPQPTAFQYLIFRVVLALAAAGVAAVIPGFLNVKFPYVRAGGALAVFVIVYYVNPAALVASLVP